MAKTDLKRTPWTRRHALTLLEKIGAENPRDIYRRLRKRWVGDKKVPAELKVHIILGGAVCEWLEDLAQSQLIRCVERQKRIDEDCAIEKVSSSILSHLATDIGAILALCREGYDVQARSLIRSFIEKIDLLICAKFDLNFALSYLSSQSFEGSRSFFYKHISGGKLAKKARKHFQDNFPDSDFIHEWLFVEWRSSTNLMLASAAHPNHTVAIVSLFPNLGRGKSNAIGFGGHPSNGSNATIVTLLTACMPLHHLFASYPYDEALQYMQEMKIDMSERHNYRPYHGLLLGFPLVNTWLSDLQAARELPSNGYDNSLRDIIQ